MNKKLFAHDRTLLQPVIAIGIASALLAAPFDAHAAEWRIEPLLRIAGESDDNATLDIRTDQEPDITGYILEGAARFEYTSATTRFLATPRLLHRDYGDEEFDSDDQFFTFEYDHDTQSSNFGIRGSYGRELVRTAERADADLDLENPDDILSDDSGRVGVRDRRERLEIVPDFTYRFSNVSSLAMELRLIDVAYDEGFQGVLTDYNDLKSNITYRRDWSARNTAILAGTFRQYESEGSESITGYGVNLGFERKLGENTVIRTLVGAENTELGTGGSDVNGVANISIVRRLQTITMLAQYRRIIAGGGGGTLTARDMLNLNFTRRLNEKITAGLGARAYSTSALEEGVFTVDERKYLQLRAQFIWNLNRTVSFEANYRYTILNRDFLGEAANSNNIWLGVNWRPTPFIRSL